jgi:hypothetical protein
LTLKADEIVAWIEQLENESKAVKDEILRLCWYMRGSLSYDEGMQLSYTDREIIGKIIKSNMETTEKSGLPFF